MSEFSRREAIAMVGAAGIVSLKGSETADARESGQGGTYEPPAKKFDMYFPNTEKLGASEMRVIACGTGMPAQRLSQAATCFLVELGNDDKFIFDVGSGSGGNLGCLQIPYDYLNKVFLSHLHQDHVGDLPALWIGGWTGGRHGALHVYGPSGAKPELGTKHFVEKTKEAYSWDYTSRLGVIPTGGGALEVHEFDYKQENQVVYEQNGVTIRSWPAIHAIDGPVSYSLEWQGLKFVFSGDTEPNNWYAKYARNADLAIHECFMGPDLLMAKYGFGPESALNVATKVHTPPAGCGLVFEAIKPRMAVAYHFFNDFDTRYLIFQGLRRTYSGPLTLATDRLVWNVTKDDIQVREVIVDEAAWPAKSATPPDKPDPKAKTPFSPFVDAGRMDTSKELQPLIDKFKRENNMEG